MQNLVFNLCFGLILCLPPDWAMLKKALEEYERKHIQTVVKAQQKRFYQKLNAQEKKTLANLQSENKRWQKALTNWQEKPTSTADRDKILKQLANLRTNLLPLQEKYAKILQIFADERQALKPVWRAEMDAIIEAYNAQINPENASFFAKHNFGVYDDEDAFLLWDSEIEAAAGANED